MAVPILNRLSRRLHGLCDVCFELKQASFAILVHMIAGVLRGSTKSKAPIGTRKALNVLTTLSRTI